MKNLIDKLYDERTLPREEMRTLLENYTPEDREYLFALARRRQLQYYGNKVFTRGLIEISNYCKNDCIYCGIRRSNRNVQRYHLNKEDILECCKAGYEWGFRTFVMQGGEDGKYTDDYMCDIISAIKSQYPDCAVTLSLGERSRESYQRMFDAGADRYLLRHETATESHYSRLHPEDQLLSTRIKCLYDLKDIGYQVGTGFMVGSPYQTTDNLLNDLEFIQKLQPEMIGIGPFISHKDTPFKDCANGTVGMTLFLMGILRLMNPKALIPATTALGTIQDGGRELGVLAGANVVMPNLSPVDVRKKYMLYDNKLCTGDEAAESCAVLKARMERIGYQVVSERGDHVDK
ncbi:MAG: [Oscillospiraceae bacterium]|nr:[FeFe] hydrogenase H-cluster radical SAM maturase HydE [Oscillospiraceae bacterium]